MLLTDLTSAPDHKSIGIKSCQKISEKVSLIPISILDTKIIASTCVRDGLVDQYVVHFLMYLIHTSLWHHKHFRIAVKQSTANSDNFATVEFSHILDYELQPVLH